MRKGLRSEASISERGGIQLDRSISDGSDMQHYHIPGEKDLNGSDLTFRLSCSYMVCGESARTGDRADGGFFWTFERRISKALSCSLGSAMAKEDFAGFLRPSLQ